MSLKKVLGKIDFSVNRKEFLDMKRDVDIFMKILQNELSKSVDAEVFLGGSFAKETLSESNEYDADIFVRFDWKYENISDLLEESLKKRVKNSEIKRMHGSRDYFKISGKGKLTFEVVPVTKIKNVKEARNVTDLSYFHVKYVKKKLNDKLRRELSIAKRFLKANGFYGAESYIQGFSGYGLECLIIYFKSFEKMLRGLANVKKEERLVIDIEKFYKKKNDVFFNLNESKLHGPIVLIDPTWKERNVLASLSAETFLKFQSVARNFLRTPSEKYFVVKNFDSSQMMTQAKKMKAEYLHLEITTSRQEGDIAGTKMKKFFEFLVREASEYYTILGKEFYYLGSGVKSEGLLVLKSKKEFLKIGPPVSMKKEVAEFKAKNRGSFVKNGIVYCREKIKLNGSGFVKNWVNSKEGKIKMKDMSIERIELIT